ncbi:MAG: MBL fold metallo-hydrolase [Lachnospiraceae bacterium]|nr:MBL fold metallo-hydrolase [Lachnospiraceae bacterium]
MSDDKNIRVRIQRGASQIGGVCTEVFTDQTRIFFDFGTPLEGEGNQDKLEIEGLTKGKANTDAVFLTHYHGDHVGEVPGILPEIPVYMHKTARRILQAQQEHKVGIGEIVWAKDVKDLSVDKPKIIKDLKITPLASDHSACDSLMYLVEGYGKRILITGDYRLHGFYSDRVRKTFENIGHINLMITEGTNLDRNSKFNHDEKWVTEEFKKVIKKYKYVFLFTSSSNIDRIAAFSRCVPTGQYVIADEYQQKIQRIADENREEEFKSNKVLYYSNYLKAKFEEQGGGMVVRSGDMFRDIVRYFSDKYPDKTCLIYSMWQGYEEKFTPVREMLACCKNVERIHVSGHVTKEDLEEVISTVRPEKVIVHHTSGGGEEGLLILPIGTQREKTKDGEEVCL